MRKASKTEMIRRADAIRYHMGLTTSPMGLEALYHLLIIELSSRLDPADFDDALRKAWEIARVHSEAQDEVGG